MQWITTKPQKLKNIVNKFATTLLLTAAVISAPVVYGDGDIATNKTIIDSFKEDLQKEEGLSQEERQRYSLLYTEFLSDLSSVLKRTKDSGASDKKMKKAKKRLKKRIKAFSESTTWRKVNLLKMYERWLKQVSFNKEETKDKLCAELADLQRIASNYNNYLNGWELNYSYTNLTQQAIAINERFEAEIITKEEIKKMSKLDDYIIKENKTELAEDKVELAKNEAELAEDKVELAKSKEINKKLDLLVKVL